MVDRRENTPFVIEFKSNYGSASAQENASPSTLYCLRGKQQVKSEGHCHRQRSDGLDVKARKKLIIASVLCIVFMIAEIVGGVLSNSLAIATDAAHLLTDFASFMISLFAIWIAGRPSTQRMSFGWYRAEVIGAVISVVMIWVITGILIWLAVIRVINKTYEVDARIMLITSAVAIIVNVVMGFQLHHHGHTHTRKSTALSETSMNNIAIHNSKLNPATQASTRNHAVSPPTTVKNEQYKAGEENVISKNEIVDEPTSNLKSVQSKINEDSSKAKHIKPEASTSRPPENINVRAAFIHVHGDVLQSIGVFIAALVIYFKPEWAIADPICTFLFSVIVLFTTFSIMKDAMLVLMEGTPNYLHYAEVMNVFLQIEGVERVHNLRIWALSINKVALSAHLAIKPGVNPKQILQDATSAVHLKYNFFETTIQIEDFSPEMEDCKQCLEPGK